MLTNSLVRDTSSFFAQFKHQSQCIDEDLAVWQNDNLKGSTAPAQSLEPTYDTVMVQKRCS